MPLLTLSCYYESESTNSKCQYRSLCKRSDFLELPQFSCWNMIMLCYLIVVLMWLSFTPWINRSLSNPSYLWLSVTCFFVCFCFLTHEINCDVICETSHMPQRVNCKIKEINFTIVMLFFIFYSLWTSVTFDTSIIGDPNKKLWKENNSNFHMIPITQNINFAACDRFSQITSQLNHVRRCPLTQNKIVQLQDFCAIPLQKNLDNVQNCAKSC